VQNHIIADNNLALDGAAEAARDLGYTPHILTTDLSGDVRDAAHMLARIARNHQAPACLLAGGETTVTIRGNGKGGRNQELALRLALELEKHPFPTTAVSVLSLGTDGSDGPTDAAGGLLRPETLARARTKGLHPEPYLENNDSYTFLQQAEALLITGPTRTNVMDVVAILLEPAKH
jgi:hydroxypyruvate reductase